MCSSHFQRGVSIRNCFGCSCSDKKIFLCFNVYFPLGGHDEINEIYRTTEQRCQRFTKLLSYCIFSNQAMYSTALITSICSICVGHYDTEAWELPYNLFIFVNTQTLWGWYLTWFIEFNIGVSYYIMCMVAITSYFVCCCFYIDAMCEHFAYLIRLSRNYIEWCQKESDPENHKKKKQEVRLAVCQSIQIHAKILE